MPTDFLADDMQMSQPSSQPSGRDFLAENEQPKESLGTSAALAIPRMASDAVTGLYKFAQKIPDYYETAKTEVPGALNVLQNNPRRAGSQAMAGLAELGQNTFNTPHDLVNYFSNRLNLVPKDLNQIVQMGRMPEDTQQAIDQTFGKPQQAGESLIRGLPRNALNIAGTKGLASTFNPLKLMHGNIAKDIVETGMKNREKYTKLYTNIFNEAGKKGIADLSHVAPKIDINMIREFSPEKAIVGVEDFMNSPTLQNAHRAKSDLLGIKRKLDKLDTFNTGQAKQYKAVKNSIRELQDNMFKDKSGMVNNSLLDKYNKIQKGYSREVIPYSNRNIGKYMRNEMSAKELVNSLSHGEFRAKRGRHHPEIALRGMLMPLLGTAGGLGVLNLLYKDLTGSKPAGQ
jgi:hypothetical protein